MTNQTEDLPNEDFSEEDPLALAQKEIQRLTELVNLLRQSESLALQSINRMLVRVNALEDVHASIKVYQDKNNELSSQLMEACIEIDQLKKKPMEVALKKSEKPRFWLWLAIMLSIMLIVFLAGCEKPRDKNCKTFDYKMPTTTVCVPAHG